MASKCPSALSKMDLIRKQEASTGCAHGPFVCKCPGPVTHSLRLLPHCLPSTYEVEAVSWVLEELNK